MRRFLDGLTFGAGFAVSFLLLSYLAAYSLYPLITSRLGASSFPSSTPHSYGSIVEESRTTNHEPSESALPYHELPFETQIDQAIAIVITKYEMGADGRQKAMIAEYLKGTPTKDFPYRVGDEMSDQSFYPRPDESKGDGAVIFYVGRPDISQMSFQYKGDRLNSFGDMPLEILRKKCKKAPDA